jgi:uncharacterized protein YggU (UPF0235/DUF167 family)
MIQGLDKLRIRDVPGGAVVAVKAVPGGSRDKVVGVLGDCLKIATAAPAEKGRANAAVAATLAAALGVDGRAVSLVTGQTRPRKEFLIAGVTSEQVRARLTQLP